MGPLLLAVDPAWEDAIHENVVHLKAVSFITIQYNILFQTTYLHNINIYIFATLSRNFTILSWILAILLWSFTIIIANICDNIVNIHDNIMKFYNNISIISQIIVIILRIFTRILWLFMINILNIHDNGVIWSVERVYLLLTMSKPVYHFYWSYPPIVSYLLTMSTHYTMFTSNFL